MGSTNPEHSGTPHRNVRHRTIDDRNDHELESYPDAFGFPRFAPVRFRVLDRVDAAGRPVRSGDVNTARKGARLSGENCRKDLSFNQERPIEYGA